MKPSILVVMLDFLVCSLLLFVIGTGGQNTQSAVSAPTAVHEEFSTAALQAQQEEWNRDYEQQTLLTQLKAETTEKEQLRARLNETSATLASREANLRQLSEEKARVEQAKTQTETALKSVETQLGQVAAEREKLAKEGEAAKERVAQLQTEQTKLEKEKTTLQAQATQLGQTVASQQATISTLSEGVRASQARVESQLTGLDEFVRSLPATIAQSVASVSEQQQAMQQDVAALAEDVKAMQTGLSAEENARLLQAIAAVGKGQQELQTQLGGMIKAGQSEIAQNLSTIQTNQDALREQTAKLGEQIESIKARGPGPFKAVKNARLALSVALSSRDRTEKTEAHFKATVYAPVVRVNDRTFLVVTFQTLGLAWWGATGDNELTELKLAVARTGDTPAPPSPATACGLRADPRVVAMVLTNNVGAMELAGPEAVLQADQRKLQVFKSSAAGLSFEIDSSPDLADARYLVVKRPLRGVAAWFENPAYRADSGDYVVTADGKLVGIMISREKCFVLGKDALADCAVPVPLSDATQFQRAARQYPRVK